MIAKDAFIHKTAIVDNGVIIGSNTKIWHFCHIMPGAQIGPDCIFGQNVFVGKAIIERGCKIQNNVSIYSGVHLEQDVFIGPSVVFTNVVNPRANIERKDEFRETLVKRGATIGANATILCRHILEEYCMIGAGAVVTKNVPAYAIVIGNPAHQIGWVCACGNRLKMIDNVAQCSCGRSYKFQTGKGLVLK